MWFFNPSIQRLHAFMTCDSSAASTIAFSLPLHACLIEDSTALCPPLAALRLRPSPGSRRAKWLTTKTRLFPRGWYMSPGKFLGKRKRGEMPWEKARFFPGHFPRFPRCAMRTAGQRYALAAQERLFAKPLLVVARSIYVDKVAFFGSFLGYKKERPRTVSSCNPRLLRRIRCLLCFPLRLQERTPPLPLLPVRHSIKNIFKIFFKKGIDIRLYLCIIMHVIKKLFISEVLL